MIHLARRSRHARPLAATIAALLACAPAVSFAGWYEIANYTGTIGNAPVHVSLQTYDTLNRNDAGRWRVDGSYYYDTHRKPIPLRGQRESDGRLTLCEASSPASNADSPVVPAASPSRPKPCPIVLNVVGKTATGTWDDGRNALPITLSQGGRLNDTDDRHPQLDGSVDIPMWYRTKTHMLVGVYALSDKCGVAMQSLRAVNIATGRVDRTIALDCDAGMVMTSIYANVADAQRPGHVSVEFRGGKMGYTEDVPLGLPSSSSKSK
ncbi:MULTISPECIES: hypothetical protein [Burkholderia]|uniref:Lipoprotein n=1 Tax=Burkholderia anthinoferrum TaxID=3090833 RepID=A0ABU5WQ42_9BURK|nr:MULTISPECIES: hypothetical protein [Burkholderia]MEB2504292.1 hypothetical protein [Burkholderia anthinoferrum]MEB2531418.1 hypothetical protein [Burkholderia anthinoferrum]MEB2561309.1 hypothetical protein [Burkholderia anthinoferrum]MEB2581042.1 hypothetical protein [Burkholderia anthinoferrum]KVH07148.1 hypothetical protein WS85_22835 [Burkholderia anthina]